MQTTENSPIDTSEREILKVEAQRLINLHLNHLRVSKELWQGRHRKRGVSTHPRRPIPSPSSLYQLAS